MKETIFFYVTNNIYLTKNKLKHPLFCLHWLPEEAALNGRGTMLIICNYRLIIFLFQIVRNEKMKQSRGVNHFKIGVRDLFD